MTAKERKAFLWILGDDTGTSSETIWAVMMDFPRPLLSGPPGDYWDFGRCFRLLCKFPEWRPNLARVGIRRRDWKPVITIWPKLERLYRARKYDELQALLDEAERAERAAGR